MGKKKRAAMKLFGIKPTIKADPANDAHWAAELSYWSERMGDWFGSKYGLALAPIQTDTSMVPPFEAVAEIQVKAKAKPEAFLASGQRTALYYLEALDDHGFDPRQFERILDFGVGLTRLIRHYYAFKADLYGCDVTANAVDYCRQCCSERLHTELTGFTPPLPYDDNFFDFVYANSVFTHIQSDTLQDWIGEMARITRPGGCVIVSVYSSNRYLGPFAEREFDRRLREQGYIEWGTSDVRENNLYAPQQKLAEWWGKSFEVLELRSHFKDQDQLILRKPG